MVGAGRATRALVNALELGTALGRFETDPSALPIAAAQRGAHTDFRAVPAGDDDIAAGLQVESQRSAALRRNRYADRRVRVASLLELQRLGERLGCRCRSDARLRE